MGELNIKKDSVILLVIRQPMDPELCVITYKIGPLIHSLKDQYEHMKIEMNAGTYAQETKDRATKAAQDIAILSDSIKNITDVPKTKDQIKRELYAFVEPMVQFIHFKCMRNIDMSDENIIAYFITCAEMYKAQSECCTTIRDIWEQQDQCWQKYKWALLYADNRIIQPQDNKDIDLRLKMAVHQDLMRHKEYAIDFAKTTFQKVSDESDDRTKLKQQQAMWIDELEY